MEKIATIITNLLIKPTNFNNHIHCFGEISNNFIECLEISLREQKLVRVFLKNLIFRKF